MSNSILIIKLSAFGDFVQSFPAFQAIRFAKPTAHITLLTTPPFRELAARSGWFDQIWLDYRLKYYNLISLWRFRKRLRTGKFHTVYDLQTSTRSSFYFQLMRPTPPLWSGIAKGCAYHQPPYRQQMHNIERQKDQLNIAGIPWHGAADLNWMREDLRQFDLPKNYALLVAGGSAHRQVKRWPLENYGVIAQKLAKLGITPILIGTEAEAEENNKIAQIAPTCRNLTNQTSFFQLASLAFHARCALGNDTGPMFLIAQAGCPVTALFSKESVPNRSSPLGADVEVISSARLENLEIAKVWDSLSRIFHQEIDV